MLGASLFESLLILPGHMTLDLPLKKNNVMNVHQKIKRHWFEKVEEVYGTLLEKILPFRWIIFGLFIVMFIFSMLILKNNMKFVMFPNEETREIVLKGEAETGANRFDTAKLSKQVEDIIQPRIGKEVIGVRTSIARSRRGSAVEENKFRMLIEIVPKEKRAKSADMLIKEFERQCGTFVLYFF